MIFDELVTTTHSLVELKRKTDLKNNKAAQDSTDAKYRVLLTQANSFVETLDYLYSNVTSEKSMDILVATRELLLSLEKVVESGLASQDELVKSENAYKAIQNNMKREWLKLYASVTGATVSTLEAIKGIDSENVSLCLQKIVAAESWDNGVNRLQTMMKGLENAEQLIERLGLDDDIIFFLQNTRAGNATLKDLNDKVLNWIRNEHIESKIRISFVKK